MQEQRTIQILIVVAIATVSTRAYEEPGTYDASRLLHKLFIEGEYNREIRPVENASTPIFISLGVTLMQLLFVDERSQVMKTNVWIQTTWTDYRLSWDPIEFGGITAIRIRSKNVWRPGIVLMNNADGKYEPSYEPNVVLYSHGTLLYIPPAIYKSSCEINVEFFPFDEQRCQLKLASWTYSSDEIQYGWYEKRDKAVMQDYMVSGTWDVMSCPGRIENASLHGVRPIRMVVFTLTIRRKTLFFTVNLIIPCIMLAFLSTCVFYLPSDAGEKITLSLSLLFAINVFLLLVFKMLPATGKQVPLISKYLIFTSAMNITSILSTVINNNINYRTPLTHYMPKWIRSLFVVQLPKFLFMKSPVMIVNQSQEAYLRRRKSQSPAPQNGSAAAFPRKKGRVQPSCDVGSSNPASLIDNGSGSGVDGYRALKCRSQVHRPQRDSNLARCQCASRNVSDVVRIVESVIYMAEFRRLVEENKQIRNEWKFIAAVIDRILLLVYVFVTTVATIVTFANAPNILENVDQDAIIKRFEEYRQAL